MICKVKEKCNKNEWCYAFSYLWQFNFFIGEVIKAYGYGGVLQLVVDCLLLGGTVGLFDQLITLTFFLTIKSIVKKMFHKK